MALISWRTLYSLAMVPKDEDSQNMTILLIAWTQSSLEYL